ncbi:MAG: imelysin family protein [Bacteroidota bacterium]
MKRTGKFLWVFAVGLLLCSCADNKNSNANDAKVTKKQVIAHYATIVLQNYTKALEDAKVLQTAITTFTTIPTEANFTAAKNAWLAARDSYGTTEAFRECNGPIDTSKSSSTPWGIGNEGQMNAWPIDESYIDYVATGTEPYAGSYDANSIINNKEITISVATLTDPNSFGGNESQNDKSISTGWHAIEFLLWGQDNTTPAANLPGQRPYTDYTTANNADRRKQYLNVVTQLLVDDLQSLVDTWKPDGMYASVFAKLDEDTALRQLINGAFFIAGDELSSERIIAPVDSTDGIENSGQEDEHSCFADNTDKDIVANTQGVYNVVFGQYETAKGASFYDLVKQVDEAQAKRLLAAADEAMAKVNAIDNSAAPFDLLITKENSTDTSFGIVMQSVVALQDWADEISASATLIGINLQ